MLPKLRSMRAGSRLREQETPTRPVRLKISGVAANDHGCHMPLGHRMDSRDRCDFIALLFLYALPRSNGFQRARDICPSDLQPRRVFAT